MIENVKRIYLSEIEIVPIKPRQGLLGFATFVINDAFYIGSVGIHSTPDGSIRLLYPDKVLINGKKISVAHPINKECGELITEAVLRVYRSLLKEVHDEMDQSDEKGVQCENPSPQKSLNS